MEHRRQSRFKKELRRLSNDDKKSFSEFFKEFDIELSLWEKSQKAGSKAYIWPKRFRVKKMTDQKGIMECAPRSHRSGIRATFNLRYDSDNQSYICEWRRIGDHSIYKNP